MSVFRLAISSVLRSCLLCRPCAPLTPGSWFVFPVDEVFGTHRFNLHDLKEPPATVAKSNPSYTQGLLSWGNKVVGFLNGDLLFSALNRSLS